MFYNLFIIRVLVVCFMIVLATLNQKVYGQIPTLQLDPLTISIKKDTRGFQGPKPTEGDFIEYLVSSQSFLPDGINLKIPIDPPDLDKLGSLLANPYVTLLTSLYIDKANEKLGRLALSAPDCKEPLIAMMNDASFEEFSKATQKLMEGVDTITLLLLVRDEVSERFYAYYRLSKPSENKLGPVYIRSLVNIGGVYFIGCSTIADPMPLNIWNALILGKDFYIIK